MDFDEYFRNQYGAPGRQAKPATDFYDLLEKNYGADVSNVYRDPAAKDSPGGLRRYPNSKATEYPSRDILDPGIGRDQAGGEEAPRKPDFNPTPSPATGRAAGMAAERSVADPGILTREEILRAMPMAKPPMPGAQPSAESILEKKEAESRPDNTREMTNFQRRYLQAVEAQIQAANQAREQAKWLMLAQIGFGMSSGRPDALATAGPNAVANMYGVNRDYTNAQNSIADNYKAMMELQRHQSNDEFSRFNANRTFDLNKQRAEAQQKYLESRAKILQQKSPIDFKDLRKEAEEDTRLRFGDPPKSDGLTPVDPAALERWRKEAIPHYQKYIKDRMAGYANSGATGIGDMLDKEIEFGDLN